VVRVAIFGDEKREVAMEFTLVQAVLAIMGANLALIVAIFGIVIGFFFHIDKKIDSNAQNANRQIEAIYQEIKDFHGKLCAIEERKKIEVQR